VGDRTPATASQPTTSRAEVFTGAALAAGALATGGLLVAGRVGSAASAPSREQDERILNFALGLEYLQAAFYAQALEEEALSGELLEFAEEVGEQERRHVEYLQRALRGAARAQPSFAFGDLVSDSERFMRSALVLEESGVGAYVGQAANLTFAGVAAAAPIISVEARHAAWIRDIAGENPAPRAADPARTGAQVHAALERAGFQLPGLGA
jgi:Ferritin-like domain